MDRSVLELVPDAVIWIGLLSSTAYCLAMLWSARSFFARPRTETGEGPWPPITVLKPLKGLDAELYENLRGLCRQDYDRFQIVCGVADAEDPAVAVVRLLQHDHPKIDIELVIDARIHGSNHKVSNLHNMYAWAKHEVIVIADSDIRVSSGYLRELATRLRDSEVGIVTTMYRASGTGSWPSVVESLCINTDWCHMVLVARVAEKLTYAFGATIALRRSVLDEIGGFLPIADHLADDYQLGHRVAGRGYRIVLSDRILETVTALAGWQSLIEHQLRWARTYRICRPGGFFASIFTHATLWALLNVVFHSFAPVSCAVSAGLLSLRYACAALLSWRYLDTSTTVSQLALVAPKDLFVSTLWLLAFAGDTVTWSGRRLRVRADGTAVDVTVPPARHPEWAAPPTAPRKEALPSGDR